MAIPLQMIASGCFTKILDRPLIQSTLETGMKIVKLVLIFIAVALPNFGQAQRRIGTVESWIEGARYPEAALRKGQQGLVRVRYEISENGQPERCKVEWDSNAKPLGLATCKLIIERARYVPAGNAAGQTVRSEDLVSIIWELSSTKIQPGSVDFGGAIPNNSPASWFTPYDISPGEIMQNGKGGVELSFSISPNGRMENCGILDSSGDPQLDQRVCDLVVKRARFKSPIDEHGEPFKTGGRAKIVWWTN